MTWPVAVFVAGEPVAAGRARHAEGVTYTPPRYRRWKAHAARLVGLRWHHEPLDGPLEVLVLALWPRPKSSSPTFRRRDLARQPRPSAPDVDNVAKAALDALTQGGAIVDDRLVVHLHVVTAYAAADERPGVCIYARPLVALPAHDVPNLSRNAA